MEVAQYFKITIFLMKWEIPKAAFPFLSTEARIIRQRHEMPRFLLLETYNYLSTGRVATRATSLETW